MKAFSVLLMGLSLGYAAGLFVQEHQVSAMANALQKANTEMQALLAAATELREANEELRSADKELKAAADRLKTADAELKTESRRLMEVCFKNEATTYGK